MTRFVTILLLLLTLNVRGANIYVSQSGNGVTNSLAWLNSNWASINAGDVVHLCGTLTDPLTLGKSGSAGNPITVVFDLNAKFSAPTWTTTSAGTSGIIGTPSSSISYITIDGGVNGTITATDNGYTSNYNNGFYAVNLTSGTGLEIKNLNIVNLSPRFSNQVDVTAATAIRVGGAMVDLFIHNNNITNVGNGIVVYPQTGVSTNIQIYSNNVFYCSWGIYCESASDGAFFKRTRIWRNRINCGTGWDGPNPGPSHTDGIIAGVPNQSTNSDMMIYWNIIGPDAGFDTTTAAVFWETTQNTAFNQRGLLFGNVFLLNFGQKWNTGFSSVSGNGIGVYNNTYAVVGGTGSQTALDVGGTGGSAPPFAQNNAMLNVSLATYLATENSTAMTPTNGFSSFDFNYAEFGSAQTVSYGFGVPGENSTTSWGGYLAYYALPSEGWVQTGPGAGWYQHGSTYYRNPAADNQGTLPALVDTNGLFQPLAGDTRLIGMGTNLTAMADSLGVPELKQDILGNTRPATGNWTIGAFEVSGAPDTNLYVTVIPVACLANGSASQITVLTNSSVVLTTNAAFFVNYTPSTGLSNANAAVTWLTASGAASFTVTANHSAPPPPPDSNTNRQPRFVIQP